jgi:hypothetical protein
LKRDPFWVPLHPSDEVRDRFWKMLGKYAGKKSTVMVGVKY